jgi:oligoendopeptidase F
MLSQKILAGDKKAVDAYLKFLGTGSSKYPMEILKDAGVDMASPEPVQWTLKLFSELIDEMERLLAEK